ncbi:ribonuclease E inhibitor RraB [Lysobacter humi (ex Lee et al. 2017)]
MKTTRSLQRALIPDDENGEVLRAMFDDGDDLSLPREIDFHLVFGEEAQARGFAEQAATLPDLLLSVPAQDEEGIWVVTASRHMPAAHSLITSLEKQLALLAQDFEGYPDGWSASVATTGDESDGDAPA